MQKWTNHGDVDFITNGGCLVKKNSADASNHLYDVFYLNTEYGENGNENFAAYCFINLADKSLDWDGMFYAIGREDKAGKAFEDILNEGSISPTLLAKEMVEYMGVDKCSPVAYGGLCNEAPEAYVISDDHLEKWLRSIGADEFI